MDVDAQNYQRFSDGDTAGLAALVDAYKQPLTLYLCTFAPDVFTAEDWMEDTFVKLAVKKPRFSGRSSFKTFLFAVARNVALDHLRRRKKTPVISLDDAETALREQQSVEQQYLRHEAKIRLHRAMETLPAQYRQVLYLRYFEDLPPREIAEALHKRPKQVESLLYHAKQTLKAKLEQEGISDEIN